MRKSIVALATATACGAGTSGSTAPTQVTGTIYEAQSGTARSFVAQDAIVDTELAKGFVLNGPAAYVEITDFGSACADEANATNTAAYYPPNGQALLLGLAKNDASGVASPPTAPGIFTVLKQSPGSPNQLVAVAYYMGGCQKRNSQEGESGSVNLTKAGSDGAIEGTFDVVLSCGTCPGQQTHLTGSFHAAPCAALSINRNSMCP